MEGERTRKGSFMALVAIVLLMLLSIAPSSAFADQNDERIDVLFVGNSYTYSNDAGVAEMLNTIAAANGRTVNAQKVAYGGASLSSYASSLASSSKAKSTFENALASESWDYVVLQEQTKNSILNPTRMYCSIDVLVNKIRSACPGAHVLLYMTPGYADGKRTVVNGVSRRLSISEFQAYVQGYYASVADRLSLRTVPVGLSYLKWASCGTGVDLYGSDRKHPSPAGFFLSACCFYYTIFGDSPAQAVIGLDGLDQQVQEQMFAVARTRALTLDPATVVLAVGSTAKVVCNVPYIGEDTAQGSGTTDPQPTDGSGDSPAGNGDSSTGDTPAAGDGNNPPGDGNGDGGDPAGNGNGDGGDPAGDGTNPTGDGTNPAGDGNGHSDPDNNSPEPQGDTWTLQSLDPVIASVAQDGTIKAVRQGKTTVFAQNDAGDRVFCYVSVESDELLRDKLILEKSMLSLVAGESATMTPKVSESLGAYKLKWSSSDKTTARVDVLGTVMGRRAGTAVITVTDTRSGRFAKRTVKVKLPVPTGLKVVNDTSKLNGKKVASMKLTWKSVPRAKLYRVYRSIGGGDYRYIASTKKTYFQDKKPLANKIVSYKVQAVGAQSSLNSTKSDPVSGIRLTRPSLKAKRMSAAIKLSWSKNKKADGYIVYRATGKHGSYRKLTTLKSNKLTEWKDGSVKKGRTYRYKVKCYRKVGGKTFYSIYSKQVARQIPLKASKATTKKAAKGTAKTKGKNRLIAG